MSERQDDLDEFITRGDAESLYKAYELIHKDETIGGVYIDPIDELGAHPSLQNIQLDLVRLERIARKKTPEYWVRHTLLPRLERWGPSGIHASVLATFGMVIVLAVREINRTIFPSAQGLIIIFIIIVWGVLGLLVLKVASSLGSSETFRLPKTRASNTPSSSVSTDTCHDILALQACCNRPALNLLTKHHARPKDDVKRRLRYDISFRRRFFEEAKKRYPEDYLSLIWDLIGQLMPPELKSSEITRLLLENGSTLIEEKQHAIPKDDPRWVLASERLNSLMLEALSQDYGPSLQERLGVCAASTSGGVIVSSNKGYLILPLNKKGEAPLTARLSRDETELCFKLFKNLRLIEGTH